MTFNAWSEEEILAINEFCAKNSAQFLGCMENDNEFVFDIGGKIVMRWWLIDQRRLGTFQEYVSAG